MAEIERKKGIFFLINILSNHENTVEYFFIHIVFLTFINSKAFQTACDVCTIHKQDY